MFDTGRSSEGIACPAGYMQVVQQSNRFVVRSTQEDSGYNVRVQNVLRDLEEIPMDAPLGYQAKRSNQFRAMILPLAMNLVKLFPQDENGQEMTGTRNYSRYAAHKGVFIRYWDYDKSYKNSGANQRDPSDQSDEALMEVSNFVKLSTQRDILQIINGTQCSPKMFRLYLIKVPKNLATDAGFAACTSTFMQSINQNYKQVTDEAVLSMCRANARHKIAMYANEDSNTVFILSDRVSIVLFRFYWVAACLSLPFVKNVLQQDGFAWNATLALAGQEDNAYTLWEQAFNAWANRFVGELERFTLEMGAGEQYEPTPIDYSNEVRRAAGLEIEQLNRLADNTWNEYERYVDAMERSLEKANAARAQVALAEIDGTGFYSELAQHLARSNSLLNVIINPDSVPEYHIQVPMVFWDEEISSRIVKEGVSTFSLGRTPLTKKFTKDVFVDKTFTLYFSAAFAVRIASLSCEARRQYAPNEAERHVYAVQGLPNPHLFGFACTGDWRSRWTQSMKEHNAAATAAAIRGSCGTFSIKDSAVRDYFVNHVLSNIQDNNQYLSYRCLKNNLTGDIYTLGQYIAAVQSAPNCELDWKALAEGNDNAAQVEEVTPDEMTKSISSAAASIRLLIEKFKEGNVTTSPIVRPAPAGAEA